MLKSVSRLAHLKLDTEDEQELNPLEVAKYTDANGMPRAPKSIAELMARTSHRKDLPLAS